MSTNDKKRLSETLVFIVGFFNKTEKKRRRT
jgi:hypothetical protein